MIVDHRIYTCHPGKLAAFVKLYEEAAWPLQQKYLKNCLGWFTTTEGELNTVVHLWGYDSLADRDAKRGAMAADPAWGEYLAKSASMGLLQKQENRICKPAPHYEAYTKAKG